MEKHYRPPIKVKLQLNLVLNYNFTGSPKRNKRSSFEKSSSDDEEIKENLYGTSDQPGPLSTSFEKIRLLSMESEPEQLPRTVQMSSAPCTPAKKSYRFYFLLV